jgi:hypothetical protein
VVFVMRAGAEAGLASGCGGLRCGGETETTFELSIGEWSSHFPGAARHGWGALGHWAAMPHILRHPAAERDPWGLRVAKPHAVRRTRDSPARHGPALSLVREASQCVQQHACYVFYEQLSRCFVHTSD